MHWQESQRQHIHYNMAVNSMKHVSITDLAESKAKETI